MPITNLSSRTPALTAGKSGSSEKLPAMPVTLPSPGEASAGSSEKLSADFLEKLTKLVDDLKAQQKLNNDLAQKVKQLELKDAGETKAVEEMLKACAIGPHGADRGDWKSSTAGAPKLLSAFYHDMDVTYRISDMVTKSGGTLKFKGKGHAVNRALGDPARGEEKILCLTWIDANGDYQRKALRELQLDKGTEVRLW